MHAGRAPYEIHETDYDSGHVQADMTHGPRLTSCHVQVSAMLAVCMLATATWNA
jgi:hypothetical protein